jgi:hypothetical protein
MDDDARRAARRRAGIAFGLAGVLLVVNVVAAFAWREERRDRLDGARIEVERRLDERFGDEGPWGRGDRDESLDAPQGPGSGRMPGGGDDDSDTRPRRGPFSQGGPGAGPNGAAPDGAAPDGATPGGPGSAPDGSTSDGADGADGQGGAA